ncbi:3,4-dihydroxy-2-butanone-4-phosphate synthase [Candidatus Pseudothioglobus sp. Uisw_041]|jgi:3,4-dihydroxy 2-butanone 4-phosphate synthase/GTP cyclohydrolase II|uniref:3,4-dihydroxy-2-butanone-4-phosphate synthase n=1 Tax=unclassified Candidatus Pseudothioglobus TaxID=3072908 RepID=UPI003A89C7CC
MKASIKELLEDYKQGKMIILMDDENRENEGDLLIAAEKVTKEDVNFMATHGRGLICLTLTQQRCQQLNLPLMVSKNSDLHSTNFTVSIEAATGVTTGISAADRAKTILDAVAKNAKPLDIVQPGHIFPLMAQQGGVLIRAGHTEAGCDLARLAGFEPASVIVEILNDDGSMARSADLQKFGKKHGIKLGNIADLIHYRVENEKTVERISQRPFNTKYGEFELYSYLDTIHNDIHIALVKGSISKSNEPYVRVHMENIFKDVMQEVNRGFSINSALSMISDVESGVFLLLRKQDNQAILENIDNQDYRSSDDGKTFGIGAQILSDLGVTSMKSLGKPKKWPGLEGFGITISEYVNMKE